MASSAPEKDFAHLTAAALGLPLSIASATELEANPAAATDDLIASKLAEQRTVVVVALADNVRDVPAFRPVYAKLLAGVRGRLVCLGSWWNYPDQNQAVEQECKKAGGTYVYIGDIYTDPANRDTLEGPQYAEPAVQAHPHDWGMARIAERVIGAIK